MKPKTRCESDFFFFHLARQLAESGEGWTAMDAYLQIVETCNRCPIRDCPGMLAGGLSDDEAEYRRLPYSDIVPLPIATCSELNSDSGRSDVAASSLLALSTAGDIDATSCVEQADQAEECRAETGDHTTLARLLGWDSGQG